MSKLKYLLVGAATAFAAGYLCYHYGVFKGQGKPNPKAATIEQMVDDTEKIGNGMYNGAKKVYTTIADKVKGPEEKQEQKNVPNK